MYDKYSVNGALTYSEMAKYNRLDSLFKSINTEIYSLSGKSQRIVNNLAYNSFGESYYRMGYAIEAGANIPINLGFGLLNKDVIKAAVLNPMDKIAFQGLRNSMLIKARSTIIQGLLQGQSYFEMGRDIRHDFQGKASDALRIARTEAGKAQCKGNLESINHAQKAGADLKKFWIARLDDKTRPSHGAMDGQFADKNGYFTLAGIKIQAPMDSALPAGEICNCRCDTGVQVQEFKPTHRRTKEGIIKYKTYTEWKAAR